MYMLQQYVQYLQANLGTAGREEGQGLVEYALILVFISIAAIAVLIVLGPQVAGVFQAVSDAMP